MSRRNNITRRGFILRPFDLDIGYHVPCGRKCADRLQTDRCSLGMRYNIRPHCSQMKRQTLMTEFIEVSNSHTLTSRGSQRGHEHLKTVCHFFGSNPFQSHSYLDDKATRSTTSFRFTPVAVENGEAFWTRISGKD